MVSIWINPEVLKGNYYFDSGFDSNVADWDKAYNYWKHAKDILISENSSHYLTDSILNMNRAINHRIERINRVYQFKNISMPGKPKHLFEQLEYFNLVRPTMLLQINKIRNLVEHHYQNPPAKIRCEEYLDFSWYFLRATDHFLMDPMAGMSIEGNMEDIMYRYNLAIGPSEKWQNISLSGEIWPTIASLTKAKDWIQIDAYSALDSSGKKTKYIDKDKIATFVQKRFLSNKGCFILDSSLIGPPIIITELTKKYFDILPFTFNISPSERC